MSGVDPSSDTSAGSSPDLVDDLARRVSELEACAVRYDDPELSALREGLEALSGHEIDSEDPGSWVQAAGAAKERMERLETALEDAHSLAADEEATTLEQYATIPEADRADLIGATDRRAVAIYEHWDDIAERVDAGWAISTHRSSTVKHAPSKIKSELNKILDEELAWAQIYRAMKTMAELSGGEESTDDTGRVHITGGDFEFHERPTPDGQDTYKVLVEVNSR